MTTVTFDTLKFVKTLESAGVPAAQAEAMSAAVQGTYELADLVTKADLREFDTKFENRLNALDTKFENRLRELELRMTVKLGGMIVVAVGVLAAIIKL